MELSIIIVNWNSRDYVRGCLASLARQGWSAEWEVIVVDGASFDGCDRMLAAEFPAVKYVQCQENVGFARANNAGLRSARGDYILFLNPDTEFVANTPRTLLDHLRSDPTVGAVGCRLLNRDGSLQTSCVQSFPTALNQALDSEWLRRLLPHSSLWGMSPLFAEPPQAAEVEVLCGACIMMPRQVVERVGGFTETYFMYGEDLDLCYKVRQAGFKVMYTPFSELIHFGGGSSTKAVSSFSVVMMRSSVHQFLRRHRGPVAALAYRTAMLVTALARLLLIAPVQVLAMLKVRRAASAWSKWAAILRWSVGEAVARPSTIKGSPA